MATVAGLRREERKRRLMLRVALEEEWTEARQEEHRGRLLLGCTGVALS